MMQYANLTQAFFTFEMPSDLTVYRACKRICTNARNKSTALLEPIFTQFANTQKHNVKLSYMGFHPNWTIDVEAHHARKWSIVFIAPTFTELKITSCI